MGDRKAENPINEGDTQTHSIKPKQTELQTWEPDLSSVPPRRIATGKLNWLTERNRELLRERIKGN